MPTIELSNGAITYTMGHLYYLGGDSTYGGDSLGSLYYTSLLPASSGTSTNRISIYKGTRPTVRPTLVTEFSADLLLTWDPSSFSYTTTVSGTTHTVQMSSSFTNASASGVASWFAIINYSNSTNAISGFVTGSVGTTGSGADLIISDTNVVSGNQYRVSNFALTQSSVFTY